LPGVVDDAVLEGDAALGEAVRELKIMEGGEAGRCLDLRGGQPLEPRRVLEIGRYDPDRDCLSGAGDKEQRRRRDSGLGRSNCHGRILPSPHRTANSAIQ
jgi:hypothetical protein